MNVVVPAEETERLLARLRENTERRIKEGFRQPVRWRDADLREHAARLNPPRAVPNNVTPIKAQGNSNGTLS